MFRHSQNPNPAPKHLLKSSEARFSYMDNGNVGISPKPLVKALAYSPINIKIQENNMIEPPVAGTEVFGSKNFEFGIDP